ncbi:uncharacterized protein [Montipora capricornis]|uniref:uncharacterized protein isoform X2 n=1 Tax=Montipora capricornis TaxID=246305 RepID=UPI0035F138FA
MNVLLEKTLQRFIIFYLYGLFVAWIFTLIEKLEETAHERKERALEDIRKGMDKKYNMTDQDFYKFVKTTYEAMKDGEILDWNFQNSATFVFAALTTVELIMVLRETENIAYAKFWRDKQTGLRLWTYYSQNNTWTMFHHSFMSSWSSSNHVGDEISGRTLRQCPHVSCYKNRN